MQVQNRDTGEVHEVLSVIAETGESYRQDYVAKFLVWQNENEQFIWLYDPEVTMNIK